MSPKFAYCIPETHSFMVHMKVEALQPKKQFSKFRRPLVLSFFILRTLITVVADKLTCGKKWRRPILTSCDTLFFLFFVVLLDVLYRIVFYKVCYSRWMLQLVYHQSNKVPEAAKRLQPSRKNNCPFVPHCLNSLIQLRNILHHSYETCTWSL